MFLGKKSPLTTDTVIGFIQDSEIDISAAEKNLNYKPLSLREGLQKVLT